MVRWLRSERRLNHVRSYLTLLILFSFVAACSSTRYETTRDTPSGVASWYGPEFHGRPTASGERFDMNSFTCAHKEYPFGSVVAVTNVSNNKTVKCVVNDRGPFVAGRDIDLSYAAAREIGIVGSGTANVRISYLGRDSGYIKEVRYVSSGGPYTIQVGAFREMDNALRLKSGLELKYEGVYVIEASVNNSTYYRVRVGKFQRGKDASALAKAMAEEGYSPLVMHYDERM